MDKLKEQMIRVFGEQIDEHYEDLMERISMVIAAKIYAGNQGDNPLCELNRFFEHQCK